MHIEITDNLPAVKLYQFVAAETKTLLAKSVIMQTKHETREFISLIFVRKKSDGGFRLNMNLKKLNEVVEYKKFKMKTISTILHLVRPGMFMAKLDIKVAY